MVVFSPLPREHLGPSVPWGTAYSAAVNKGSGRPIGQSFIARPGQAELRSCCVPSVNCSPLELGFFGQACAGPRLSIPPVEAVP